MANKKTTRKVSPRMAASLEYLRDDIQQSQKLQTDLHKHIMQIATPEVRLAYELLVSLRIAHSNLVGDGDPSLTSISYRRMLLDIGKAQGVLNMQPKVLST